MSCDFPNAAEPQPKRTKQRWHSSHRMVGAYCHPSGENAMNTVWSFLVKFASLIACTLHCFDRVIFKGHLALAAPRELEFFVDCVLNVRRSVFMKTVAPQYSELLV